MRHAIALWFFLVLCLAVPRMAEAKVYLVAVGISNYPGTDKDLRYPVSDVRKVVNTYVSSAADLRYVQLCDKDATVSNVIFYVREVFALAGADDIVVLFVSGHGYEGGFMAYDGMLSWTVLREAIAESESRHKMIFADACFSGTFRGKDGHVKTQRYTDTDVMLFLSSRSDETSREVGSLRHGVFTAFLCGGLGGKADKNQNKIVTAKELHSYVYKGVLSMTNGRQHPVMWGNFSDDMPVMVLKATPSKK